MCGLDDQELSRSLPDLYAQHLHPPWVPVFSKPLLFGLFQYGDHCPWQRRQDSKSSAYSVICSHYAAGLKHQAQLFIFFALYRFRKPFYLSLADLQFSPHLELWCPWCHLFLQIYDTLSIYSWSYFLIFIIGTFSIKIWMNQKIPHPIALASSNTSPFSSSLKTYKNT